MINVTKHAVERYIERVMGLNLNRHEMEDMICELGGYISQTINTMITDRDVGFKTTQNREIYHVVYRDIGIVIAGAVNGQETSVITLYKFPAESFLAPQEKFDYINTIVDMIQRIKKEISAIEFNEHKKDEKHMWKKRIGQYSKMLFSNPLYKIDEEE